MKQFDENFNTKRYRTANSATIVSITLVLFMLGLVFLLLINTSRLKSFFRENIGITVIIKSEADAEEVLALKSFLEKQAFVKSTTYISKQQAADQLKGELGEDFIDFIGYNPLPATLEVFLFEDYTYGENLNIVEAFLQQQAIIESIEYQHTLITLIEQNIARISRVIIIFSLLLLLISVLLIHNTIRLAIYSKRMLIKSMLLVGATQSFIRRPFIVNGILQGLISSMISILMLLTLLIITHHKLPDLDIFKNGLIIGLVGILIVAFGILITWLSNLIAIKKYLT